MGVFLEFGVARAVEASVGAGTDADVGVGVGVGAGVGACLVNPIRQAHDESSHQTYAAAGLEGHLARLVGAGGR